MLAASCLLAVGQPGLALAEDEDGGPQDSGPAPYQMAKDAKKVNGTPSSTDGPLLQAGTYTDSVSPDQEKYYTIELDSTSDVYVSVVAAPPRGTKVGSDDNIEVEMASTGGDSCGDSWERGFGSEPFARPIAEYTTRQIEEDGSCQEAGTYLVQLTRSSDPTSTPVDWPVELKVMVEPSVSTSPSEPPEEDDFNTEPPAEPTGAPKEVAGGTGFNDAPAVGEGVWKDRVRPGETRYFRVPIEWGQQLFSAVEFGNHANPDDLISEGVRVELYNTARGYFGYDETSYDGGQTRIGIGTPPALYANRFSSDDDIGAMRFSGWYYLTVSLHPSAAEFVENSVPFTLRMALAGKKSEGPRYSGDAEKAGFGVTEDDRSQAEEGLTPEQAAERDGGDKTLLAIGGLGLGTALLLGLGLWMLLARRRAAATPVDAVPPANPYGYGPPGGWR